MIIRWGGSVGWGGVEWVTRNIQSSFISIVVVIVVIVVVDVVVAVVFVVFLVYSNKKCGLNSVGLHV